MGEILKSMRRRFMLSCKDVNEFLMDYLDGTLPEEMRRRFEKHIENCDQCRAYLEQYQATASVIGEAGELPGEPPEELVENTLAFLKKHRADE